MLICGFRQLVGQYQRWLVEVADGSRHGSLLSLWLQGIWRLDCGFWTRGFWLASKSGIYIYIFFLSGSGLTCDDASNGSVFALIPKLTQHNQNKIERTKKIKGYDLGVST